MNGTINFQEITIINGAGVFCLLFLLYSRYTNKSTKRVGDNIVNGIIVVTVINLIIETASFYIDGLPGKYIYFLQYFTNSIVVFSTTFVGYVWCLFTEFKIHRSLKMLHKKAIILCGPVIVQLIMIIADCFGTGFLFCVSADNVYSRGKFVILSYVFLGFYYLYSIIAVHVAKHRGNQIHFFPVYTFVLPCIIGTVVQGLNYGVAAGWFSVAIAILLIEMQLQKEESFVDELSGLYNRKYLEFMYNQIQNKKAQDVFGIMMDINYFKKINDVFGHTVGDDAIRTISMLLSQWVEGPDMVIRFAGDEFVIICINKSENDMVDLIKRIKRNLDEYNSLKKKPYELTVAAGYTEYTQEHLKLDDFLREMDRKMYEDKNSFKKKHVAGNDPKYV